MSSPSSPPPRLTDVARKAGVSLMTASRVLREPGKVADATRRRVLAAVIALGYVPNMVAGSLKSARTKTVGVVIPTIVSSLFADTVNGLTRVLEDRGFGILMAQSGYEAAGQERALAALLGRRPEALVLVGSPLSAAARAMLNRAVAGGITVIETWELPKSPIDSVVGFDNAAAGAAVARHFAAQGRRKLAYIGSPDIRGAARWRGFVEGCRKARIKPPKWLTVHAPPPMDDAAAICADPKGPGGIAGIDAIFAANDVHAMGAMSGLRAACRRVPDDVAVIGLGDLEIARHLDPALTTVRIDGAAMGRAAGNLILARTDAGASRRARTIVDVGFELIRRNSG